jgi:hypothetical protein
MQPTAGRTASGCLSAAQKGWDTTVTGCFICPIYDKRNDFEYGYRLTKSAARYAKVDDLYFVLSSYEQRDKFLSECGKRFGFQPGALVYAEDMSACKNPVSIKKLYAVRCLKNQYDYIAAIDCECVFTRKTDMGVLLHEIWQKGTYLVSNPSSTGANDLRICAEKMGMLDSGKLAVETRDFRYTWWFNEIPVYRAADLDEFFAWLDRDNHYDKVYGNWSCFDYLVYGLWLIMYKAKHLRIYNRFAPGGMIENLCDPKTEAKYQIERECGTHWTARRTLIPPNEKIHLKFHLDRSATFYVRVKRWLQRKWRWNRQASS